MKKLGLLFFIIALSVGIIFANSFDFGKFNFIRFGKVQGSGIMKVEKRELSNFSKIEAGSAVNVEISIQDEFSVEVESDDNLLQNVKTVIKGNTLKVYTKGSISTRNPINVRITMPSIDGIDTSGASKANVSNISADALEIEASGASKIKLNGVAKIINVDASGASKIDAENLKVENANTEASGASFVAVSVIQELKADASGASKILYYGTPANITKNKSGASFIVEQ